MSGFETNLEEQLQKGISANADVKQLYAAVSNAAMAQLQENWQNEKQGKTACYFSAEFLIGRMVYSNLHNLELLNETKEIFKKNGIDPAIFEEIEDAALGNGGLGRLAACFLDSAATENLNVNGFGIRYKYGLFKQRFDNGFQKETGDDWQQFGDPWSVRKENEKVQVCFGKQKVWAVPYDMPVIGHGGQTINTLRLWQAEADDDFDFEQFNNFNYDKAFKKQNEAAAIHSVLYPNDDTEQGKELRIRQQYFFSSASLQSILKSFKAKFGTDFTKLADAYAVQLNDTHPVVSIPELLRILVGEEGLTFEAAFEITRKVFAYTNHTIMAEALEKWDIALFAKVLPEVYPYVVMLDNYLHRDLAQKNVQNIGQYAILSGGQIHMARMAIYASHSTNGVAALHTEILKNDALREWYELYPQRFNNKTNGVTQRRWLSLCNPELSQFITKHIGDAWVKNFDEMKKLKPLAENDDVISEFVSIKNLKKQQLATYIKQTLGVSINPASIFDIQIKRLHEYKRQLLNAFAILDIYFRLKSGELHNISPITFLFGAKAAPGYKRAKGIIKFINEIAKLVNSDDEVNDILHVLFVPNYNVSFAEKLIPAADFSEQISTAGTEASGTGNMKLMINGAVTLGTYDGANVEIVQQAGEENNYIFGARVEDIKRIENEYSPQKIYNKNKRIKRVMDTLIDGTFDDDDTGVFKDLHKALLKGATWHKPDNYYLLLDFESYVETKLMAMEDYKNTKEFAKKCFINMASSSEFSSDRTIRQYASEIWGL